ncbi:hypothetical protein J6590_041406 [Homalodisca vitripennis]|nr:hypothetical protein J6590_041406 [Homalodisca vitripennis]
MPNLYHDYQLPVPGCRRSTTSTAVVWRVGGGGGSIVSLFCYTYNTGTGHRTNQCRAIDGLPHQLLCGERSTTSTVVWRVGGGGGSIVSLFCYIYNTGTGYRHRTNQYLAVDGLPHQLLCGEWEEWVAVLCHCSVTPTTLAPDTVLTSAGLRSDTSTVVWRVGGGGASIVSLFCYTYNTGTGHCTNQCLAVGGLPHQLLCGEWEEVVAVLCHCSVTPTTLAPDTANQCRVRSDTSTVVWRVGGGGGSIVSLFCYTYNTGTGHRTNQYLAVGGLTHQLLCGEWEEVVAVLCHCSVTPTTLAPDTVLTSAGLRSDTSTVVWRVGGGGASIVSLFCYTYNTGTGHRTNQYLAVGGLTHQLLCGEWEEVVAVLCHCSVTPTTLAPDTDTVLTIPGCRRSDTSTVVWRVGGGGGSIVSLFCYTYNTGTGHRHRTNQYLAVGGLTHQLLCGEWEEEVAVLCHCSVTSTTLAPDTVLTSARL